MTRNSRSASGSRAGATRAGAINLLLLAPVWMQITHLLLADLVWISLVLLAVEAHPSFGGKSALKPTGRKPDDLSKWRIALSAIFDSLYSERRQHQLDRLVMKVSVAGLIAHLAFVFLARTLASPPRVIAAVGKNYLSAIYTPFSFILFYEVLMLIGALPQSTTQSIAKQYEIVSLIFIRGFFKDIAELHGVNELITFSPETWPVFLNVSAGLAMFLMVTVFLHAARRRGDEDRPESELGELEKFIARKKVIALGLTVLLLGSRGTAGDRVSARTGSR